MRMAGHHSQLFSLEGIDRVSCGLRYASRRARNRAAGCQQSRMCVPAIPQTIAMLLACLNLSRICRPGTRTTRYSIKPYLHSCQPVMCSHAILTSFTPFDLRVCYKVFSAILILCQIFHSSSDETHPPIVYVFWAWPIDKRFSFDTGTSRITAKTQIHPLLYSFLFLTL